VVSKSGITPTPWQVMLELEQAYTRAGVDFANHAVATTVAGSELDQYADQADTVHRLLDHLAVARPEAVGTWPGRTPQDTMYFAKSDRSYG
jgi:hypothetical protein